LQREILIVTTFKEFDGGRDDEIQSYWLSQLHNQTYKNFRLIVTNFREKFVKTALEKSGLPFEFFQSQTDCLYSLSDMLENTIKHVKPKSHIILYPSPDHMFQNNFFEMVVENFEEYGGGTSFPHPQFLSIEDYQKGEMFDEYLGMKKHSIFQYDPNKHLPETFYFDADLLLSKSWQGKFFDTRINGTFPGISLHLCMLGQTKTLKNLVFKTRVSKLISHVNPETNELDMVNYLSESHKSNEDWYRNERIVLDFCQSIGLKRSMYNGGFLLSRKLIMAYRFKAIGTLKERIRYLGFLLYYTIFPVGDFIIFAKALAAFRKLIGGQLFIKKEGSDKAFF